MNKIFTPKTRTYIYEICLAFAPLLIVWGWTTDSEIILIMGVIKTVLGLGTAVAYRPTKTTKTINETNNTVNNTTSDTASEISENIGLIEGENVYINN